MLGRIDTEKNLLDKFITDPYAVAIVSPMVSLVSAFALSFFSRGFVFTSKDYLGSDNFKNGLISLLSPFFTILPGLLVIEQCVPDIKLTKIVLLVSTVFIYIGSHLGTGLGYDYDTRKLIRERIHNLRKSI